MLDAMRPSTRTVLLGASVYALIVAGLAFLFPGKSGGAWMTYAKWFLGIPFWLLVYAACETSVSKLLNLPFWSGLPSVVRILLLVLIITLVTVLVLGSLECAKSGPWR